MINALGVGGADVVERLVVAAGQGGDLVHVLLDDGRDDLVVGVGSLTALEVDVRVLGGAANVRVFRVHGALAEGGHLVHVQQGLHVVVVDGLDLLDLVGGPEAVEEGDEGHAGLDGGEVGHQGEVHDFLDGSRGEHGEAGLAAGHDILVVAEDGQGVGRECAGRHVEDAGQQFAGDLVHVRDHQEQTLGGGEGGGQCATGQAAVDGAGSAGLGLQLADLNGLPENILAALSGPFISDLAHGGRGRDGVDGGGFTHGIGHPCGGGVTIHRFHLGHSILLLLVGRRNFLASAERTRSFDDTGYTQHPCQLCDFLNHPELR